MYFSLDDFNNRTLRDWRYVNRHVSPRTNAKRHALKYGAAGCWLANDSLLMYYRDGGKVFQKTFKHAVPISPQGFAAYRANA